MGKNPPQRTETDISEERVKCSILKSNFNVLKMSHQQLFLPS